jgi:hypothetical protein
MSFKTRAVPREPLSYDEFMARHVSEQSVTDFLWPRQPPRTLKQMTPDLNWPPLPPLMQELRDHPFFRLLRAAGRENCPDAYNALLYLWLRRMGMRPPEGVLVAPSGKPGRPRDHRTSIIYAKWLEIGEPPLGRQKLAHAIYGAEFTKASSADRKKMVDRCRRAVERRQAQVRPNQSR